MPKKPSVGDGSHSCIASRSRARCPSVLCHSGFLWVIKWKETRGDVTLTQTLGPACMKQRRS
jgi:ribosome modulation factor